MNIIGTMYCDGFRRAVYRFEIVESENDINIKQINKLDDYTALVTIGWNNDQYTTALIVTFLGDVYAPENWRTTEAPTPDNYKQTQFYDRNGELYVE